MKRILFLFAGLVALSTTAFATNTVTSEAEASINNYVRGYGNSFIFVEGGIEFSVFADGQFDFYLPNYGPDVSIGINRPGFSLSFNSGYDYNPYVQYDSFGAIIQIENTPVYYDYYGRVNQVGNIFINYNSFGRISRVGGLNVYYRNNAFWRYDGFINIYNRAYVYRPWHRFYAVPPVNFCVVNVNPYRRYYAPVRHIYYRPYTNNVRHYNVGRRGYADYGRRNNSTRISNRYAQQPRNRRERSIQTQVRRNNTAIAKTRAVRTGRSAVVSNNRTNRNETARSRSNTSRSNTISNRGNTRTVKAERSNTSRSNRATKASSNSRIATNNRGTSSRSNARSSAPKKAQRSSGVTSSRASQNKSVARSRTSASKNRSRKSASAVKPSTTKSRTLNRTRSQSPKRNVVTQSKRKASSVSSRSNTSRKSSTRSGSSSRRKRG